jgi:hypothetical protein
MTLQAHKPLLPIDSDIKTSIATHGERNQDVAVLACEADRGPGIM